MYIDKANFFNKNVILRCDYNVPLINLVIQSTRRIDQSIPTINSILSQKPNRLIIISHLGRPKGKDPLLSLKPVLSYLSNKINKEIVLTSLKDFDKVKDNKIIMLENIRYYKEETKQLSTTNDFRKTLSSLGNVFVNDAFGCCHRAHSSIVGINTKEKYLGYIVKNELKYLNCFNTVEGEKSLILGGSKVSDKIQLIKNLIPKVDNILIGGGMVFAFFKYKNINIGNSLFNEESLSYIPEIYKLAEKYNTKIILPVDFNCNDDFSNEGNIINCDIENGIPDGHMGLDIGKKSIKLFNTILYSSKCVVWNGPLGVTEFSNFSIGSRNVMKFLSILDATTIIGGGDTACCCEQFNLQNEMTHVSTGGGASLEVLEGKKLPGISIIE